MDVGEVAAAGSDETRSGAAKPLQAVGPLIDDAQGEDGGRARAEQLGELRDGRHRRHRTQRLPIDQREHGVGIVDAEDGQNTAFAPPAGILDAGILDAGILDAGILEAGAVVARVVGDRDIDVGVGIRAVRDAAVEPSAIDVEQAARDEEPGPQRKHDRQRSHHPHAPRAPW
jgi:hypothetical protein